MIEEYSRVHATTAKRDLKMKVLSRGSACAPRKSDDLTCLHLFTLLDKVLGLMAIQSLGTISVLDAYTIAITIERT